MPIKKYTLPDFSNGLARNLFFIKLSKSHPEYFMDDLRIESVYGCFPSCIMNGGRTYIMEQASPALMEQTFALLEDEGVIARLTFTNMLVTPEHVVADPYVKSMLDIASRHQVEVIVYSDELGAYLKENYGFKIVLSTTRGIDDVEEFNQLTKQYDYLVLNYNLNKDRDFLSKIEQPAKVEVMVNEFCQFRCPRREAHYLHNSEDQLKGQARPFPCDHQDLSFFDHAPDHPVFLTNEEISQMSNDYGISYFKIVGRGIPFETILESYCYYLIKPEYREQVKHLTRLSLQRRH